ncbi:MAG: hypothetical protein ACRDT2_02005 [Natronosporangium sp.]
MTGSSVPAAMSYLHEQIKLLPACAAPVVVNLGFPAQRAETWVSIGVEPDDDETETELIRADLGANSDRENPVVPCVIRVRSRLSDPNAATAQAVEDAFTIFDAVAAFVRKDQQLGGNVTGDARIPEYRMRLTNTQGQAGEGRVCRIYFTITWSNFL